MTKFLAIVKREYLTRVRTKMFIVATVLGLGYLGVKVLRMTDDEWARGVGQVTQEAIHATS